MARRNPADGAALDPALTQKKRARRRLVGAIVLGIAAAVVLPLVLDSEPRQTITDVEIEIPPREAALPAIDPPKQAEVAPPAPAPSADDAVVPPAPSEPVAAAQPDAKADVAKSDARSQATAKTGEVRTDPSADTRRSASKTDAKVATTAPRAEPPPRSAAAPAARSEPAAGSRFALQVGAYANAGSARAQLDKARRAGVRAYTETVKTAQGERTRVRVGPFPTREEAEKARATLKLAGIESAVVDAR